MLNEAMSRNRTVELPRAEPTRIEPTRAECFFLQQEKSIKPKLPETLKKNQNSN